jgi:hypothetical protein
MQVGCHPMFVEENFDAAPRTPWVKKLSALYILNQLAEEYVLSFCLDREHDWLILLLQTRP